MVLEEMKFLHVLLSVVIFLSGFAISATAQDFDLQSEQDRKVAPKNPPKVVPGDKKEDKKDDRDNQNPPANSNSGKGRGRPQ